MARGKRKCIKNIINYYIHVEIWLVFFVVERTTMLRRGHKYGQSPI